MLLGISVPAPPPPPSRPTLVCRQQTVIHFKYTKQFIRKIIFNISHNLTLPKFLPLLFSNTTCHSHSGKVDSMVSNLQAYPVVTVTNTAPVKMDASISVEYLGWDFLFCSNDYVDLSIASGDTWTASSRGLCLVTQITVRLSFEDVRTVRKTWMNLKCAPYKSSGTAYSNYSIIMNGVADCCVRSSNEIQVLQTKLYEDCTATSG